MSSYTLQTLELIALNNNGAIAVITVVVYDYILTLPREINYIWRRPWTWVSTLYTLARYLGIFLALDNALIGSAFLPGSLKVYVRTLVPSLAFAMVNIDRCAEMYLAALWVTPVFLAASELVMILRVYAMWNRSKTILGVLLLFCIPQVILAGVTAGLYQIMLEPYALFNRDDVTICNYLVNDLTFFGVLTSIPRSALSILLLIFAISQTLRQSVEMYKATKKWQPNKYMKLFVKDGMLFFVLSMLIYTAFIPRSTFSVAENTPMVITRCLSYLYYGPFIPHLIISVRELYDRDLLGRSQGIDTGFGILSHPTCSGKAVVSTIVFADAARRDAGTEGNVVELIGSDGQDESDH